jgi:hypothetical protein
MGEFAIGVMLDWRKADALQSVTVNSAGVKISEGLCPF